MDRSTLRTAPNLNSRALRRTNRLRPLTSTIHPNNSILFPAGVENLQEETMQLKKKICYLSEENVILNTKVKKLECELRRKENELQELLQVQKDGIFPLIHDGNALLVNSLRQKVVRLEQVLRDKEDEVHKLKCNIRSTRLQEANIEIETLYQEIRRLQSAANRNSSVMSPTQSWLTDEEKVSSTGTRCVDSKQLGHSNKEVDQRQEIYDYHGKIQVPKLPQLTEESDDSFEEAEIAKLRESVKQLEANLLVKENQLNQMSAQLESCMRELDAKNAVQPELVDEMLSPISLSPRLGEKLEDGNGLSERDAIGNDDLDEVGKAGAGRVPIDDLNALLKFQAAKLITEALCAHLARMKHLEMLCDKYFDIESTSLVATNASDHQIQHQSSSNLNNSTLDDVIIDADNVDDGSVKICGLDSASDLVENLTVCSDDETSVRKQKVT
uniref:Janus kinase and microtubule-interacting protein C-terminal domain-containing protein n=1 Tax=Trichuris muris TaxID=70415 RepID=A0A5S6QPM3_TRIMR